MVQLLVGLAWIALVCVRADLLRRVIAKVVMGSFTFVAISKTTVICWTRLPDAAKACILGVILTSSSGPKRWNKLPSVNFVTAEVASLLLNFLSITTQSLVLRSASRGRKACRVLL